LERRPDEAPLICSITLAPSKFPKFVGTSIYYSLFLVKNSPVFRVGRIWPKITTHEAVRNAGGEGFGIEITLKK